MLRKSLILFFAFAAIAAAFPTGKEAARDKRGYLAGTYATTGLGYSGLHEGYGYHGSGLGYGASNLGYGVYPGAYSGLSGYSGYEDYGHLGSGDHFGGYSGYHGGYHNIY